MKPYLTLFIGVLAVSCAAIFIRLAEAPPLVIAAYRLAIASLIIIPIASVKSKKRFSQLSRHELRLILLSSVFVALHFGLWITSLSYTSIASSVVLVTAHPAFVAVLSYFLWRERLGRLTTGGIIVAFIGVVFINYSGFTFGVRAILGDGLALIAGLAMGGYLIIGRYLRDNVDLLGYLAILYTCAAVILVVASVICGHRFVGYSTTTYTMLVLLALVPQLIGHSGINLAVRLMPATFVSVAILGEPVGATLLGYFILGEVPSVSEMVGGFLILGGIFLVMRRRPRMA